MRPNGCAVELEVLSLEGVELMLPPRGSFEVLCYASKMDVGGESMG